MVSRIHINGFSSIPYGDSMRTELTIEVKGMHCNSCAAIIKDRLSKLKGVESVEASFADERATIIYDKKKISKEKIMGELEGLGYRSKGSPAKTKDKKSMLKQGIVYGLTPHIGCIGFIVASILGVTIAVEFFRPLLMNPWFFHILVLISIGFATGSAIIYLKKNGVLSMAGIKRKQKYLATMYGSTVGINLILFLGVFPLVANFDTGSFAVQPTGAMALAGTGDAADSLMRLQVNIPCPGHAPLISGELKTIKGVTGVKYEFPNYFDVAFDSGETSKEEILLLEVFQTYPATVESESASESASFEEIQEVEEVSQKAPSGAGSCGGECGGSSCGGASGGSCTGSCSG